MISSARVTTVIKDFRLPSGLSVRDLITSKKNTIACDENWIKIHSKFQTTHVLKILVVRWRQLLVVERPCAKYESENENINLGRKTKKRKRSCVLLFTTFSLISEAFWYL